jgi:hypothetical protein
MQTKRYATKGRRVNRHAIPMILDPDGDFVDRTDLIISAHSVSRSMVEKRLEADLRASHADLGQHDPDFARLAGPLPGVDDPCGDSSEEVAIDPADRDWHAAQPRSDWAAQVLAELAASEPFDIPADRDADHRTRAVYEEREVARLTRGRSMRIEAGEEARMYGGF